MGSEMCIRDRASPPLRTSPPSRSVRLGSTTPDRPASKDEPPTPPPTTPDSPPPAAPAPTQPEQATDATVEAAATGLSVSLLSFGHREWEQAQRDDPLCDAVRRYFQLGCPNPLPPTFCDHVTSHKRPDPADILILLPKDASPTATTTQYCWYATTPQPAALAAAPLMIPSASTYLC